MRTLLAGAGLLGGLFWITIRFFPFECAQITEESEVLCNRLWSPALLAMLSGFIGLFLAVRGSMARFARGAFIALPVGLALMFVGNFVEYWTLNQLPHQGQDGFARGLAWMTVLFGFLIVLVASAIAGFVGFRLGYIPRWLSLLFVLLFPASLAIALVNINLVGMPIGVVSAAVGMSGLLRNGPGIWFGED